MDFDQPKVYGDTSITDGLVFTIINVTSYLESILPLLALKKVKSPEMTFNTPHKNSNQVPEAKSETQRIVHFIFRLIYSRSTELFTLKKLMY